MRKEPIFGEITAEQRARMEASEARVARLRARANVEWLPADAKDAEGAVNCAKCRFLLNFSAEKQGGWCGACRRMVATWHPVRCQLFQESA